MSDVNAPDGEIRTRDLTPDLRIESTPAPIFSDPGSRPFPVRFSVDSDSLRRQIHSFQQILKARIVAQWIHQGVAPNLY